jgi:hypothetical protein
MPSFKTVLRWLIRRVWKLIVWAVVGFFVAIPAVVIGDSAGHVGMGERAYSRVAQWWSAAIWVTALPWLIWSLRFISPWEPAVLLLELPLAFFLFGRRFSADRGREMGVRQFFAGLKMLTHSEGTVDAEGTTTPGRVRIVTVAQIAAGVVMAFGAVLQLSTTVPLLRDAMSSLSRLTPWAPVIVLAGFLMLLPIAAIVGVRHARDDAGAADTEMLWSAQLAAVLGISLNDWFTGSGAFEWSEDQTRITVTNVPIGARTRLDGAEARCASIIPRWTVLSASSDRVELGRIESLPDVMAARQAMSASGGLIVGFADLPDSIARPSAIRWTLNPDSRAVAASVAELARSQGLQLVEFNSWKNTAIVARLPRETARLRDRLAGLLGYQPHEIEILVSYGKTEGGEQYVSEVQVLRAPEILDPARRRSGWMLAVKTALPQVDETIFRFDEDASSGKIRIRRLADPLREGFSVREFTEKFMPNHAGPDSWRVFPIAVDEDGGTVPYATFHTLGIGQTGAGKGSVWWTIFNGFLPAARLGLAEFYAIDPKGAEAIGADGQPLAIFEEVAKEPDAWSALLVKLAARMDERSGMGRSQAVTTENPLIVILIDELSALGMLDTDPRRKKETESALLKIASQGRSMNVFIVALAQMPHKEMIGNVRSFLAMRVALRVDSTEEADMVLGKGAVDRGAEAHLIPIATSGNGYRTAGVGFVQVEGDPNPVRMRLPYTSDAQIAEWNEEFRERRAAKAGADIVTEDLGEIVVDFSIFDEADETPPAPPAQPTGFAFSFDE